MGIEYSSVFDAPRDDVFAWHARPGAIHRLLPPWQPMSVVAEAASLADGRAVLGLPGGLRWNAQHNPADYAPPARFVDELSRGGLRSLPSGLPTWRRAEPLDQAEALEAAPSHV